MFGSSAPPAPSFLRALASLPLASMLLFGLGCGYSEQEWQVQLDKYNRVVSREQNMERKLVEVVAHLEEQQKRVTTLEADLEAAGVDVKQLHADLGARTTQISDLSTRLADREQALLEFKQRAEQLARVQERFARLRQQLAGLQEDGVVVSVRRNRMIISLPGDALFDKGRDTLRPQGLELLTRVAATLNADATLRAREYEIAAHTDNQPTGARFVDGWALSLMRARQVLLFLVDEKKGGLPINRWNAAGFADTDPVTSNETPEGQARNRRCEIVLLPSTEEMLDLKRIGAS